jgi:hypothetical protein
LPPAAVKAAIAISLRFSLSAFLNCGASESWKSLIQAPRPSDTLSFSLIASGTQLGTSLPLFFLVPICLYPFQQASLIFSSINF